ncbi:Acetylornithine deacetylase [Buchnera aphidicola (Eriosoma lanigerum)]|uniref:acetylornithine deacetylase n=1 Tax=Buchnera aphidicola TaxID=9 RepID=UPI0034642123
MKKFPSFIQIYKKLIQTNSINSININDDSSNKIIIDILANWLYDLNFSVEIQSIPKTNNKFNLLATMGSGPGGLLISGHSDTVNVNTKLWNFDPFQLTIRDNKFYGLGAVDMKGFFACILDLLHDLNLKKNTHPLYILITADEETTMSGAKYFSQFTQIKPKIIFIGEPTSLKPIIGHKGHISKSISVQGKSGHSSDPNNGINSIDIMHLILNSLFQLRDKLKYMLNQKQFQIPYSTMNCGYIHGGKSANIICDFCTLHIDIRLLPNLSIPQFDDLMFNELKTIQNTWGQNIIIKNIHEPIPSYALSQSSDLLYIVEYLSQKKSEFVNYCTEASFMQYVAPTIILGPGSINQAHQPDEYLDMNFIKPTKNIFKKFIQYFCKK